MDDLNRDSIRDGYQRWCQESVRYLNILSEVPHHIAEYCKDDIQLDLDERHRWLLDDIVHTYDHCRRILYRTACFKGKELYEGRNEHVENLLDCYSRLYTILDKTAKLVAFLFPWNGERNPNFRAVVEKHSCDSNPFLRALYYIARDVFSDKDDIAFDYLDPHIRFLSVVHKPSFVRNNIMHNTIRICNDDGDRMPTLNVESITPYELFFYTSKLADDVREVLINLQMAVRYNPL